MRIGIDARPLALESYTGIPKAVYEITKYWLENHPEHEYFMLSSIPVHFVENLPENWHVYDKPQLVDNQKFWALFELPKLIRELKLDVFWGSNYLLPRRVQGVRYCVTVYDLAIFRIPDMGESYSTFRLRVFGKNSCRKADSVVAISRATAEDVHEIFHIPRKKIAVSYCGGLSPDDMAAAQNAVSAAYGEPVNGDAAGVKTKTEFDEGVERTENSVKSVERTEKCAEGVKSIKESTAGVERTKESTAGGMKMVRRELAALEKGGYFLFISTIEPRKNITTIVHAFELYKDREKKREDPHAKGMKLVLAGNRGWKFEEILAAIENSPWREEILMPGYVSDEEKAWLLNRAAAFLYPSLYEGFGIPILEAMHYGCPVVTSAVSAMPEVGGDAAFYIADPKDSHALADRMEKVKALDCEALRDLRLKMKRQAGKFSWKKNAEQMLQILCRKG